MLSMPVKSRQRRNTAACLRKQGNFVKNRGDDVLRPVKQSTTAVSLTEDYLPCSHCLGFYKRQFLYRHTKTCPENKEILNRRQTALSDGQTTLLMGNLMKYAKLLTKALFPRMRADKINLVAKKDMLICQYGYSYMKGRKSKGNLDFVRQNIRRLAKLLMFCRQEKPEFKDLIHFLKPTCFSLLLKAKLIEAQWADEISAQAALNLNENKWNKSELLPLTTDIKKLSAFLQKNADDAFKELQLNNKSSRAYNLLKEVVYTQIILLNRRRPAEVAQIKIDKYQATNNTNDGSGNVEFENCLTETENILLITYTGIAI
ncbi:hypothetical protein MML48_2g00016493 [Holotrichia oblita]|uniref:Uncharacterized protein n=1 Tax=Holotrichia oblita TaxID=644536 RepID=A0ACB9TMU3_HOLOL|nr:hypothetical protein MML48_2g00016493 [Holotrichia oblita]